MIDQDQMIDALIEAMTELQKIENEAKDVRETLEKLSVELHVLNDKP